MSITSVVVVGWRYNCTEMFNSCADHFWKVIAPADNNLVFYFSKALFLLYFPQFPVLRKRTGKCGKIRVFGQ